MPLRFAMFAVVGLVMCVALFAVAPVLALLLACFAPVVK